MRVEKMMWVEPVLPPNGNPGIVPPWLDTTPRIMEEGRPQEAEDIEAGHAETGFQSAVVALQ